ncbi:MAG: GDP-L-fucose synthase [Alphaproteobacteria bacterium]|nr:GDP-L-fucose synthase [Alphaproteobacteria bacterium]MDE2111678.1 GDP-L-fucose synthase [Alphaproteobacteria bacterium]MDE2494959.1 GDP-L-fucose synthase [Alphaproteobacteria bacterium]
MSEVIFPLAGKRVFVAGHSGMAGGAILRRLARENCEILTADRSDLDMCRQREVEEWLATAKPDAIFLAAAKVGGIHANTTRRAEFLYDNLAIETNVIHGAWRTGVKKLLFLGSSCIYPRETPQPMKEEALLTGLLEPTNEAYAIAKIAGIKLCDAYRRQYGCDFISAMPTNLYGPGDRYDLLGGHVVAAVIMKLHAAKSAGDPTVTIWGTGTPRREFLFTEDLADGLVFLMKHYTGPGHLNLGTGVDVTIHELAEAVAKVAGWSGEFVHDRSKPDGMMRKVMDVSRMTALGWRAKTRFEDGLRSAYEWYVAHVAERQAGHG